MKEHQKELIIVPISSNTTALKTAKILYNNYEIGTCELNSGIQYPSVLPGPGGLSNYLYSYTLIFNDSDCEQNKSLNIALNSIKTDGFYQKRGGVNTPLSNLGVPSGTYKNIGVSPEGIRYNLELITDATESKIILSRIC